MMETIMQIFGTTTKEDKKSEIPPVLLTGGFRPTGQIIQRPIFLSLLPLVSPPKVHLLPPPAPFNDKFCCFLEDVLSLEECQSWIQRAELEGFEKAKVNGGNGQESLIEDYRNSDRCIMDDFTIAHTLFSRIHHALPIKFKSRLLANLNERFRVLRYGPHQFFRPHMDGCYGNEKLRSQITMMVYLNQDYQGGETAFLSSPRREKCVKFSPKIGSVLLFEHGILHEGSDVVSGRKYSVRTDVMYTRDMAV